jgi:FAD synthetase
MAGKRMKKILLAGTFDILHPGHLCLIEAASKLGRVIVVIGRDSIVEQIKGKRPVIPENQRQFMVSGLKGVYKAVLGKETMDFTEIIAEIQPDIIMLGPDQQPSEENWQELLAAKGLGNIKIQRFKTRLTDFPLSSTSAIIDKIKNLSKHD